MKISYHKPDCQNRDCNNPREVSVEIRIRRRVLLCMHCATEALKQMEKQEHLFKPTPGFFS